MPKNLHILRSCSSLQKITVEKIEKRIPRKRHNFKSTEFNYFYSKMCSQTHINVKPMASLRI